MAYYEDLKNYWEMIKMVWTTMFSNPTFKKVIKKTGVVAGAVVIEGIKGVAIKSATKAITTSIDGGMEGVKKLTLEDWVGRGKKKSIEIPSVKSKEEYTEYSKKETKDNVIDVEFKVVKDENEDE